LFAELIIIQDLLKESMGPVDIWSFWRSTPSYPNIVIVYRILLTVPMTVAYAEERSFSKLKSLKSYFVKVWLSFIGLVYLARSELNNIQRAPPLLIGAPMSTCGQSFYSVSVCVVKIRKPPNCVSILMLSRYTSRTLRLRRVCSSDGTPSDTRDSKSRCFHVVNAKIVWTLACICMHVWERERERERETASMQNWNVIAGYAFNP
jgi:hypothetical protein